MEDTKNLYIIYLKEIEMAMKQNNFKTNKELTESVERQAFELNIHPKLAVALANYYWSGYQLGLKRAQAIWDGA